MVSRQQRNYPNAEYLFFLISRSYMMSSSREFHSQCRLKYVENVCLRSRQVDMLLFSIKIISILIRTSTIRHDQTRDYAAFSYDFYYYLDLEIVISLVSFVGVPCKQNRLIALCFELVINLSINKKCKSEICFVRIRMK